MGGKSARVARVSLAVAVGLLSVFLRIDQAAAHNPLAGSSPADGARVASAPERIELTFLSRLNPQTTTITVTGPDNVPATDGGPRFSGTKVSVPFRPGPAGVYTVGYQLTASDGHPIKGEIKFTMTVGATPTASPSPSPAVATTSPQPALTAYESAVASPLAPSDAARTTGATGSWLPWLLGGAVVLALLVGGVLLRRRARAS